MNFIGPIAGGSASKLPFSVGGSKYTVVDDMATANPFNLAGTFTVTSAGAGVGMANVGCAVITMGGGMSTGLGCGISDSSIDAGAAAMSGATVSYGSHWEKCCSK